MEVDWWLSGDSDLGSFLDFITILSIFTQVAKPSPGNLQGNEQQSSEDTPLQAEFLG